MSNPLYKGFAPARGCVLRRYVELPPAPSKRTLVLFAHFDQNNIVDPYVMYHLDALRQLGADIVFVSASPELSQASIDAIQDLCVGVYCHASSSRDFGSWHTAWGLLHEHGWTLNQFNRLALVNDSVYGPLFPLQEMWQSFHDADMYGAIESSEHAPHLQSWFLAWDLNPKTRLFLGEFWRDFRPVGNKGKLILMYEIGLTLRARRAGLTIKPFVSATAAQTAAGGCANKTIDFWDGLIEQFKFPYLKRLVAQRQPAGLANVVRGTGYPYELIDAHQNRVHGVS